VTPRQVKKKNTATTYATMLQHQKQTMPQCHSNKNKCLHAMATKKKKRTTLQQQKRTMPQCYSNKKRTMLQEPKENRTTPQQQIQKP